MRFVERLVEIVLIQTLMPKIVPPYEPDVQQKLLISVRSVQLGGRAPKRKQ
jgi:hypothetical protein